MMTGSGVGVGAKLPLSVGVSAGGKGSGSTTGTGGVAQATNITASAIIGALLVRIGRQDITGKPYHIRVALVVAYMGTFQYRYTLQICLICTVKACLRNPLCAHNLK